MSSFDAAVFQSVRRGAWGGRLCVRERVSSTQDEARRLGEGDVVVAEQQSAGRGRWGRRWESSAGASLLFSVRLGSGFGAPAGGLPLVLGAASVTALRSLGLDGVGLKWPNDLYWGGRKLGGLLLEGDGDAWIAGCGLNVLQEPADFPPELRGAAVSLRQAGLEIGREALLAALLFAWESWTARWRRDGFAALRDEVEALLVWKGSPCRLQAGGHSLQGVLLGLADDGTLRLAVDGVERRLHSAEILGLRPAGPD